MVPRRRGSQLRISLRSHLGLSVRFMISSKSAGISVPATKEKFEPEGSSDGNTSGMDIGHSIACCEGTLEKEWIYG